MLREISLGLVLMRLFQASRRFNVEIQPQLVLLQKTLLNIEGLGRQLDPDLDLWVTAKPILEVFMSEQLGIRGMLDKLKQESQRWPQLLPQLPRLAHAALEQQARPQRDPAQEALLARLIGEQRRTQRWIRIFAVLLLVILLVQSWPWLAGLL